MSKRLIRVPINLSYSTTRKLLPFQLQSRGQTFMTHARNMQTKSPVRESGQIDKGQATFTRIKI